MRLATRTARPNMHLATSIFLWRIGTGRLTVKDCWGRHLQKTVEPAGGSGGGS